MREANIWVLITDGETARICSTREGLTTPISAVTPCAAFAGREEAIFNAWHGRNRRDGFDRSANRTYAGYLAQLLFEAGREGSYDSLIIIAAPDFVKDLNRALAPETAARLIGSIVKDVPHFPAPEASASFELRH
jgi:protein required for attachment to host cells